MNISDIVLVLVAVGITAVALAVQLYKVPRSRDRLLEELLEMLHEPDAAPEATLASVPLGDLAAHPKPEPRLHTRAHLTGKFMLRIQGARPHRHHLPQQRRLGCPVFDDRHVHDLPRQHHDLSGQHGKAAEPVLQRNRRISVYL